MKNAEITTPKSLEDKLQNPALTDEMRESIRSAKHKPLSQMMPKKHESALTYIVESKALKLRTENPDMPIKKVITTIFETLTDDIPAPLVLKLTQCIIGIWANSSIPSQQQEPVAIAA